MITLGWRQMIGAVFTPYSFLSTLAMVTSGQSKSLFGTLQSAADTMLAPSLLICGLLIFLCALSWGLMVAIGIRTQRAKRAVALFLEEFRTTQEPLAIYRQPAPNIDPPATTIYQTGCHALANLLSKDTKDEAILEARLRGTPHLAPTQLQYVEAAIQRATRSETVKLDRFFPLLGGIAASAPFLGLLGAAWCLMDSPSDGTSSALLCLVIGLLVAIPALIGFRLLEAARQRITIEMENFASEFSEAVAITYIDHGQRFHALPSLTALGSETDSHELGVPTNFSEKVISFGSLLDASKDASSGSTPTTAEPEQSPIKTQASNKAIPPSPPVLAESVSATPAAATAPKPPPSPARNQSDEDDSLAQVTSLASIPQPSPRPTAAATLAALSAAVATLAKDAPPKAPPKIAAIQKAPPSEDAIPVYQLSPSGDLNREGVA